MDVDHGYEDEEEREGINGDNTKGEENSGEESTQTQAAILAGVTASYTTITSQKQQA